MGISLTGLTPATTYDALIKVGDNGPITSALKVLSDGLGTNLPMEASTTGVNFTGALQQSGVAVPTAGQVAAKQDTLVSGTNIKTINSTSILGSGNIAVVTSPSGVSGAIQFSNGSAFASDAANLFWDDTNNRLGVGTNAPTNTTEIQITGIYSAISSNANLSLTSALTSAAIKIGASGSGPGCIIQATQSGGGTAFNLALNPFGGSVNIGNSNLGARLGVIGSGSTSATTSLLVQNSAGVASLTITDDRNATFGSGVSTGGNIISGANVQAVSTGYFILQNRVLISSPSVGILKLGNNNDNDFDRLQFGGTTSSFPAIKKASNNIEIRNADDTFGAGLSVGAALNATAILQADSTTKGFLPPRMTTTQKNAIASPAAGLVVYDSITNKLCCYNGSTWNDLF
jgi:hypothetical protein